MASLLHIAVGLAASRLYIGRPRLWPILGFTALSMLPDADVVAFALDIPYSDPFGHRGASHSLAFAGMVGAMVGLLGRRARLGLLAAVVVASHPLLDALTDGGLGVALWWPWEDDRIFASWRPIPVAPIGASFFSERGLKVAMAELLPSLPLLVFGLWGARSPEAKK